MNDNSFMYNNKYDIYNALEITKCKPKNVLNMVTPLSLIIKNVKGKKHSIQAFCLGSAVSNTFDVVLHK